MANIILVCVFGPIALALIIMCVMILIEDERCAKIKCPRYNGNCIGHKCVYWSKCEVVK